MRHLVLFLCLCSTGWAQTQSITAVIQPLGTGNPQVVVRDGVPTLEIKPNQLVKLQAGVSTQLKGDVTARLDTPADAETTTYLWQLSRSPSTYSLSDFTSEDGRTVTFVGEPGGEYDFLISIARNLPDSTKPLLVGGSLRVVVEGSKSNPREPNGDCPDTEPPVTPPQRPTPPGDKNPETPPETPPEQPGEPPETPETPLEPIPGVFGLGPKVKTQVLAKVPDAFKPLAKDLADMYHKVAEDVIDGKITMINAPSELRKRTAEILKDPEAKKAWDPVLDFLTSEMKSLAIAGKLNDTKSVVVALSEICMGLGLSRVEGGE